MSRPRNEQKQRTVTGQDVVTSSENSATEQRPAISNADDLAVPYIDRVRLWFSVLMISAICVFGMWTHDDKLILPILLFAATYIWSTGKFTNSVREKLPELKRSVGRVSESVRENLAHFKGKGPIL